MIERAVKTALAENTRGAQRPLAMEQVVDPPAWEMRHAVALAAFLQTESGRAWLHHLRAWQINLAATAAASGDALLCGVAAAWRDLVDLTQRMTTEEYSISQNPTAQQTGQIAEPVAAPEFRARNAA